MIGPTLVIIANSLCFCTIMHALLVSVVKIYLKTSPFLRCNSHFQYPPTHVSAHFFFKLSWNKRSEVKLYYALGLASLQLPAFDLLESHLPPESPALPTPHLTHLSAHVLQDSYAYSVLSHPGAARRYPAFADNSALASSTKSMMAQGA